MIYGLVFLGHTTISSQAQREGILQCARKYKLNIDKFISYKTLPNFNTFQPGDTIIVFAWNCIGKDWLCINNFIKYLLQNSICFYSATSSHCVDQTRDFSQLEYAFNLYEDIRFNFLSGKNINGVKTRIANGNSAGRVMGSKNKRHVLDGKEKTILQMFSSGASMYAISKKLKVSAPTIKRFLVVQG